jgi:hypothetical protein
MNIYVVELIGLIVGIIAFIYLSHKGVKKVVNYHLPLPSGTVSEPFDLRKFFEGLFSFFNPVLWAKDLISLFNIRKLIIYAIIIGGIFFYGYTIGNQNLPVKVDLGYGREAVINLGNGEYLHITKTGEVDVIDNPNPDKAKILRVIKVKDLGALENKLSPIGFEFRPIAVVGYGLGLKGDGGIEAGVGVSFFRYWQGSVEAFLTQKAVYVGTSYRLDKLHLNNTSIGIAVGKGYKDFMNDDIRVMIYGSISF